MIRSLFFASANPSDLSAKFPHFAAGCNVIGLDDSTPPTGKATLAPQHNN